MGLAIKNVILKNDRYELELLLEFKNCEILQFDSEWVYIKLKSYTTFDELKKEIVKIHNKSSELYCDCKKIIYTDVFEEVIKVKKNGIENINDYSLFNISVLVYGIWFSPKRSSFGPMIKLINVTETGSSSEFLPDPEDYNSDEEINESIQNNLNKFNKFKKIKVNKTKVNTTQDDKV
jgi:hypothetical protein